MSIPDTEEMKNNSLTLSQGKTGIEIVRSMCDGNMSAILSGAQLIVTLRTMI